MKGSEEQGGKVTFSKEIIYGFQQKKRMQCILNRTLFSSTRGLIAWV